MEGEERVRCVLKKTARRPIQRGQSRLPGIKKGRAQYIDVWERHPFYNAIYTHLNMILFTYFYTVISAIP